MTTTEISKLEHVDIRNAWPHEAHNFTPWLLENLAGLSEAIGITLEAEESEVSVGSFSADIIARNPMDDSRVLIENQLECSDHAHLGQILTYLAGLEAQTIIWIATDFREQHLSAIKWLNESTSEPFAFFAVKIKVVRIDGSPYAPIFEVVERPNNWERQLHEAAPQGSRSDLGKHRLTFWTAFVNRIDGELERNGAAKSTSNRWRVIPELDLVISMFVSTSNKVGIFVRGMHGAAGELVRDQLVVHDQAITERLNVPIGDGADYFFILKKQGDFNNKQEQDALIDWFNEKADLYERTLKDILGQTA